MIAVEHMPLITKLLFIAVGIGLLTPALYNVWRAGTPRKPPRRLRDPYKPRQVSQRRYDHLWVIDRDHHHDPE